MIRACSIEHAVQQNPRYPSSTLGDGTYIIEQSEMISSLQEKRNNSANF